MSMSMSETTTERALDLEAEVARLTVCLKKSNDGFEEYERKYYLEMCPEAEFEEVVDVYPEKQESKKLYFSAGKISSILGLDVSPAEVENILSRYHFEYENKNGDFEMIVPPLRLDLEIEEDMAEEVGRVLGYDRLKGNIPKINFQSKQNETYAKILFARNKLLEDGYSEVMTYAFREKGKVEVLASASDKKFLRINLTDGLKESFKLNQANAPLLGLNETKIFEIGTIWNPKEEIHVAYGDKKEIKEMMLEEFVSSEKNSLTFLQPLAGTFRPQNFSPTFKMWSLFPFIARDVAVWVPEGVGSEEVQKVIKDNAGGDVVRGPELFDEFKKDGKISYAFRLVFQSYERTLTDAEISDIMTKITNKIKEKNAWQVR